nr:TolC family protein [Azospirillum soli]
MLGLLTLGAGVAQGQPLPARSYAEPGAPPLPTAQGPELPLTLPEAVYLGLRQNPAVRNAYLQRVLDKFNLRVAESLFSPKGNIVASISADRTGPGLNGNARLTPTVQLLTPLGTAINFGWDVGQRAQRQSGDGLLAGNSALTLTVIQPLLKGAGYDVATAPLRQARLEERYNQLRLKSTVADTVTEIVRAYHQFIQARQQIALARGALSRARELEATNQALIRAGRMAEAELVQAQATTVNQELALLQAENAFDAARLHLLALLGLDLNTRIAPADRLTAEPVRVELETVCALAFDNRPDYLAQLIAIEAARIGLDVAKNQRLWDLTLNAGVNVPGSGRTGWRSTERLPNTKTDLRAGVQLNIPINDPAIERQEVQATIGLRQGEVQLEQLRAQVDRQVRDGVRGLDAAWRRYTLSRRARELAERTLEAETIRLRAGRSSNFQVVSFQDQLRVAENAELAALVGYLDALVALDQQLGTTLDTWRIQLNDGPPNGGGP